MAERPTAYPLRREPHPERRPHQPPRPQQPQPQPQPQPQGPQEPLWREVLGQRLRALRQEHQETLAETAGRAGLSPQYLSEVERGRKEPSGEMIAAPAGALGTTLTGLTEQDATDLLRQQAHAQARAPRPS